MTPNDAMWDGIIERYAVLARHTPNRPSIAHPRLKLTHPERGPFLGRVHPVKGWQWWYPTGTTWVTGPRDPDDFEISWEDTWAEPEYD